ncbi:MAG TPA: class 1 isoprenoid biosynthesis enzyme [Polyangiaceae bacterium]
MRLDPFEKDLFRALNRRIPAICRELPRSIRDLGMYYLLEHFTKYRLGNLANFFGKFYAPSWTYIHWLCEKLPPARRDVFERLCVQVQASGMLLHILDDHLSDGDAPVSSVSLQLRTQAWQQLEAGAEGLALAVGSPAALRWQELVDQYFAAICEREVPTFEAYVDRFRGQVATGLIAARALCAAGSVDFARFREGFEQFTIAWRLLDDLRDISEDLERGEHSSIYYLLPEHERADWAANRASKSFEQAVVQASTQLVNDAMTRLERASALLYDIGLPHYAAQVFSLGLPLQMRS